MVNVQDDGSLSWDASLTTEGFQNGINAIVNGYQKAAEKAAESVEKQNASLSSLGDPLETALKGVDDSVADLLANLKKVGADPALQQLITQYGDLMKQQLTFKDSLSKAVDPAQVQSLNEQLTETQAKMKAVTDQMQQLQKASVPTQEAVPDVSKIIGANVLSQLKQSYGEIDQTTQKFIQSMIEQEIHLQKLQVAQQDLTTAYAQGKVTEEDYAKTSAFMVAETKKINDETQRLTQNQQEYEASLRGTTGSINEKKQQLSSLKDAYESLSEAERNSAKGQQLNVKITGLAKQIESLDATRKASVSVRTELNQLQEQMARNPDSPLFDTWKEKAAELKTSLKEVRISVDQATNNTAGIDAFSSGLRGLIGGFTAVTGAMGLFTDNTEEFDKVTKNAASALALLNGIEEVSNVISKESKLNTYLLGLVRKQKILAIGADTLSTKANTVVTGVNTEAQIANSASTEAATVAQTGLTAALLANPAALVVGAIAAIAGAYLLLRDRTKETKDSAELLADANKKVNQSYAEKLSKVLPLLEAVKEGNITEQKSIQIHQQLAEIDNKLVDGLDRKKIAYEQLKLNVDAYADSLRNQFRLEANSQAIQESIKIEEDLAKKLKDAKDILDTYTKATAPGNVYAGSGALVLNAKTQDYKDLVSNLTNQLKDQKSTTDELVKSNVDLSKSTDNLNSKRGTDAIDKDIAALRKEQSQLAENSSEWKKYQTQIDALQKERASITGTTERATVGENEYNKALREQLALLRTIDSLKRGARQSGLIEEESELDKINQKYDDALKKIEQFNKTAPKNLQIDTSSLDAARATELQNATFKKNADEYKKTLAIQRGYFEDYEKAKLEFGEEKAKQLFAAQVQGANSYLEFLKQQKSEIEKAIPDGQKPNFQQALELQNLNKQITEENNREQKAAVDKRLEDLKTLLKATITFNEEKQKINKKYDDMEKAAMADTTSTPEEIANRLKIIKGLREQDLTDLKNNLLRQSDLYKKLGEDIVSFSRDQLRARVKDFTNVLKVDKTLSPETKAAVKSWIDQINGLLHQTDSTSIKTLELSADFGEVSNGLNDISSSLSGVNDTLSRLIGTIGKLSGAVSTSLKSLDTLKDSGANTADKIGAGFGILGGLMTAVNIYSSIIDKKADQQAKQIQNEAESIRTSIIGETEVNDLYRKRLLLQAQLNTLKIQGLSAEMDALKSNKESLEKDYNDLLEKVRNPLTDAQKLQIKLFPQLQASYDALQNKSFEELEKMSLKGELPIAAQAYFDQLQKIKQQLDDNDAATKQNIEDSKELFTGTTSDSILDSIVQGFQNGKRATADFADDFQKLMQQAILNSLKYQTLEVPLKKFYEQFADSAKSDGVLTAAEIASLKDSYNATITAASQQFEELQKITKINFNSSVSNDNSLSGAIKGITEQTAQLLAGQFGGLRITAFDQLSVARNQLTALNQIVFNTSLIAATNEILRKIDTYGLKIK